MVKAEIRDIITDYTEMIRDLGITCDNKSDNWDEIKVVQNRYILPNYSWRERSDHNNDIKKSN